MVAALLLAGCEKPRSAISDAELKNIEAFNGKLSPHCEAMLRERGSGSLLVSLGECFETLPPQRWTGVWNTEWEWSNFCPAPGKHCGAGYDHGEIALTFAPGAYPAKDRLAGTFAVAFIGRRTRFEGGFGRLGESPHMIIVDRLISIRRIGPPVD